VSILARIYYISHFIAVLISFIFILILVLAVTSPITYRTQLKKIQGHATGGLYPAPQIPAGIRWNDRIPADSGGIIIWQRAHPNLPFRGQLIPAE
jgi:hypothetical protein